MSVSLSISPLEQILTDIERTIAAQAYYPALAVALTLPEICTTLCWDRDMFVKEKHYAAFVDNYTTEANLGVDGITCYRIRGGVIHRGNAGGHPKVDFTHVIFTIPDSRSSFHAFAMKVQDKVAVMLDLAQFCSVMIGAARLWHSEHRDHVQVLRNMPHLLSYRPFGVSPFVGGLPVVASGE